ncbi:MAG: hypothetical protein NTY99_02590 [DPANN group archaeon]|nr:hypothetical protein [DPANN group archaeon]
MALNFLFQNALQGMAVQTTAQAPFEKVFSLLADFGLFRVVLPFLLIFVIFYAIITKTKILGNTDTDSWVKPSAAVIGLVAGFFVVAYTPVVSALYNIIPQAGFILVVLVLMLMVLGMVGVNVTEKFSDKMTPIAGIIVVIVVIIFMTMVGMAVGPSIPSLYAFSQFMMGALALDLPADTMAMLVATIVLLSIIGGVLYFVTKK